MKAKVNLSLDTDLVEWAKAKGFNISEFVRKALRNKMNIEQGKPKPTAKEVYGNPLRYLNHKGYNMSNPTKVIKTKRNTYTNVLAFVMDMNKDENNFIIYGLYRSSLKKFVYPKIKVVGIEEEDCYGG